MISTMLSMTQGIGLILIPCLLWIVWGWLTTVRWRAIRVVALVLAVAWAIFTIVVVSPIFADVWELFASQWMTWRSVAELAHWMHTAFLLLLTPVALLFPSLYALGSVIDHGGNLAPSARDQVPTPQPAKTTHETGHARP